MNVNTLNYQDFTISKDDKVCLIVCNPYFGETFELGQAVIEDGKLINSIFTKHGYKCFNIVDSSKEEFKKLYSKAMLTELKDFVVYYSGHGTSVYDSEHSEDDGQDECLVFKDGLVADDYLSSKFETSKCKEIFFIFDCCHSGTLADIEHLKEHNISLKVSSISGCADSECSLQLRNNGIFTYHINEYQDLPISEIVKKTNLKTSRYNQHIQIGGNRNMLFV